MSDIDHLAQMESAEPTEMSSRNVANFAKPAIGLLCDVSIMPRAVEDGDVHDEALAAARPLAQRSAVATRRTRKALND